MKIYLKMLGCLSLCFLLPSISGAAVLTSWNKPEAQRIIKFVNSVITATSPTYLPPKNRNAVLPQISCASDPLLYAPMKELIDYLKLSGFKVRIVAGNGSDQLRVISEQDYGTEQKAHTPPLHPNETKQPAAISKKASKPVLTIKQLTGAQPILTVGSFDTDLAMLQYTASNTPALPLVLSPGGDDLPAGKLLGYAKNKGWMIINIQRDFKHNRVRACPVR